MKKFLITIDHEENQLYLLHREFPACLIHIVQTTPVTFRIVDLYDEIEEEALIKHPFLEDAKKFWRDYGSKVFDKN